MSFTAQIETNLAEFNEKLKLYAETLRKKPEDVVRRQAKNLSFFLMKHMAALAPTRGSIRGSRESLLEGARGRDAKGGAINQGRGVSVRFSIQRRILQKYGASVDVTSRKTLATLTGKTRKGARIALKKASGNVSAKIGGVKRSLNLQALMVRAELNAREGGIGSLGFFSKLQGIANLRSGQSAEWEGRLEQTIATASTTSELGSATMQIVLGSAETNFGEGLSKPEGQAAIAAALSDASNDVQKYLDDQLTKESSKL